MVSPWDSRFFVSKMSNKRVLIKKSHFLAATCSYVTLPFRPSVCEFVSEWVSYAEMSQKTALFYKNIIRNAKLRKLTSVDFFKKKSIFFLLFFFFFLKWTPKNYFFLPYKILWSSTIGNILILYLRICFQFFFKKNFFQFFFSNVPNEHGRSFLTFHTSLFFCKSKSKYTQLKVNL